MDLVKGGLTAALVVILISPFLIPLLHRLKFGQSIRLEGPKSHQAKSGTPTMGGIAIVLGIFAGTIVAAPLTAKVLLACFILMGHFVLGFLDDYLKVVKKQNLGLKAREKFLGQIGIALVTMGLVRGVLGINEGVWIPVLNEEIDLGIFYYPFLLFVMVGASNAVNLTDGLDGLASGCMAIASATYGVICLSLGSKDLAVFAFAVTGATLAFLLFNRHPAKVFMGDTGSLALGGAFAALGILTHTEILLAVVGFVFVAEALSVILQVLSFQTTGKRIFRMSPIHHHFELGGWSEWRVVLTFWCIALASGILGWLLM